MAEANFYRDIARSVPNARVQSNGANGKRGPTSWTPIDLTDVLLGAEVPAPIILARKDGLRLVYAGRLHWFQGEAESGKSWAAQLAVVDVLAAGGSVLYIDYEDDERSVVARLLALAVRPQAIAQRFTYVRPSEPLEDGRGRHTPGSVDLGHVLAERSYELAVIDGVTEAMTTERLSLLDNADVAQWMRRLPQRLTATGAAVVCIDHMPKPQADKSQSRYAIGGAHKLAGLSGAAYTFETVRPFGRSADTPITGVTAINVAKDRPGHVRGRCPDGHIGFLKLTSWPDGGVTGHLDVPGSDPEGPTPAIIGAIVEYLLAYDGATARQITDAVPGRTASVRAALTWMAASQRGLITIEAVGRSHRHRLTPEGRALISTINEE